MLVLVHSGQTGVERGAQRAAVHFGMPVAGFCTQNCRDELGRLSGDVARDLTPCHDRGPRSAIEANLAIATALVLVVPDVRDLRTYTGMAAIARSARMRGLAHLVVDPAMDRDAFLTWIGGVPETCGSARLLVTGPRGTRWPAGERLSWQLVASLAAHDAVPSTRHGEIARERR